MQERMVRQPLYQKTTLTDTSISIQYQPVTHGDSMLHMLHGKNTDNISLQKLSLRFYVICRRLHHLMILDCCQYFWILHQSLVELCIDI